MTELASVAASPGAGQTARKRVLVVDDEASLRELLMTTLAPYYDVRQAASGTEALRMLQAWLPHVVLLDVAMPGEDGIATCRAIKANPATTAASVVLVTGFRDEEVVRQGLEAGADTYLAKPFHPVVLLERVAQILQSAGKPERMVVAEGPEPSPEEMGAEQLQLYARDLARLYQEERQIRKEAEKARDEVEARLRELTSLNTMFQEHLRRRFQTEAAFQKLLANMKNVASSMQGFLTRAEDEYGGGPGEQGPPRGGDK